MSNTLNGDKESCLGANPYEGVGLTPSYISIDASKSSSLYVAGLTEIRVNALYGLNLIKAF